MIAVYLGQYILMKSPRHAMGGRYLFILAPFFVVPLVLASKSWWYRSGLILYALAFGIHAVKWLDWRADQGAEFEKTVFESLSSAKSVLINNDARGMAAPVFSAISSDAQIAVCNEKISLVQFQTLLQKLTPGAVVIVRSGYRIDANQTRWELAMLGERFNMRELGRGGYLLVEGVK
jgi:hypothetical protein